MEAKPSLNRWERLTLAVWLAALLAVLIKLLLPVALHTASANSERYGGVWPVFVGAAKRWFSAEDLYQTPIKTDYFRYSPTSAALLVPFTFLPEWVGGLVWRLLGVAVLCSGLAAWLRTAAGDSFTRNQRAVVFLLVAPFAIANLNLGQSNLLLLGLLLWGLHAVAGERWMLAAGCLVAASFLKVYPVSILLLLFLVCPRRLAGWSAVSLIIGALLPFALQHPAYVSSQYESWWHHLLYYDRREVAQVHWNRDFRLLCEVCGAELSARAYLLITLIAAALIAAVVWLGHRRGQPRRELLVMLLALGCSWMTVFGMATESATYLLLIPSAALYLVTSSARVAGGASDWNGPRRRVRLLATVFAHSLLLVAQLAVWFPGGRDFHALAPQPLAGLVLFASFMVTQLQFLARRPSDLPNVAVETEISSMAA
jgi:hypothetical protein